MTEICNYIRNTSSSLICSTYVHKNPQWTRCNGIYHYIRLGARRFFFDHVDHTFHVLLEKTILFHLLHRLFPGWDSGSAWHAHRPQNAFINSNWSIKFVYRYEFFTLYSTSTAHYTPPLIKVFVDVGESWFAGRNTKVFIAHTQQHRLQSCFCVCVCIDTLPVRILPQISNVENGHIEVTYVSI